MTREQLNLELLRIWSQHRKTVVFITHSIAESIFLSDRVFVDDVAARYARRIIAIDLPRPRDLRSSTPHVWGLCGSAARLLDAKGGLSDGGHQPVGKRWRTCGDRALPSWPSVVGAIRNLRFLPPSWLRC